MASSINVESRLRRETIGLLIGFAIQFFAGMVLNLFVNVPSKHPGAMATDYFSGVWSGLGWALSGGGGWTMAFHVYLAIALVLGTLSIVYHSIRAKNSTWVSASTVAAIFTIGALFNGLSYINYDHDFSSLIMALAWLVAVVALVVALLKKITIAI